MKRISLIILLIVASLFQLSAEERYETISFRARVPEDYGVSFPDNAARLDKFVFELESGRLVTAEGLEEIELEVGGTSIPIDVLFYGNTEEDYSVEINVDSTGWIISNEGQAIPVTLSFSDYLGEDGIEAKVNVDGSVTLLIPSVGVRNGDKVTELLISWESPLSLRPGYYILELGLTLRSDI